MYAHGLLNAVNMNYLSWFFGIAGATVPVTGNAPDMIICQSANNSDDSRELRHTIYHEYGHTLHYFKAGAAAWENNIFASMGPGYGDNITEYRGSMFALSEGWADYVGHSFAFKRYGTAATRGEWNVWTFNMVNGHYRHLLEEVPTFFNDFIPRGLFYDLTDGANQNEPWDNINGFTMNSIYHALMKGTNVPVYSIQQFRERWEQLHPDVNNNDLFNQYNVQ
jgi:hypothetical protein